MYTHQAQGSILLCVIESTQDSAVKKSISTVEHAKQYFPMFLCWQAHKIPKEKLDIELKHQDHIFINPFCSYLSVTYE